MAKTYRDLWPLVVDWDNLLEAYRRCRRRKRFKREALRFHFAWESNLLQIQRELTEEVWLPGPYRHSYIYDPKRRKISAAPYRDRVVHHALVNVVEPLFERRFIDDSYACRRGKGTHRAVARAQEYLRRHRYVLKTDIIKFFPNVDHEILLAHLGRTLRDERLMDLIRRIIASGEGVLREEATPGYFPGDDLFALSRPTGLPIGNLTSQFFANVLLDPIDHLIKETMRVPGYIRYADDLALFGDSKGQLWDWYEELAEAAAKIRLRLHPDKTQIRPTSVGLKFLGFVVQRDQLRLQQRGIRRFNRRLRRMQYEYRRGRRSALEIRRSMRAWGAHAAHANSAGIRRELWRKVKFCRPKEPPAK